MSRIDAGWLRRKTTVEECERKYAVIDHRAGAASIPFAFLHESWLEFKGRMQDGDELWEFSTPPRMWELRLGRAGICIVRDGTVLDCFTLSQSGLPGSW